jgi:hypothetical protein
VGILLRDLILKSLQEKRLQKKKTFDIYLKYSDPLASSASSLLWRLNEIFYHPGRGIFLKEPRTDFEIYKSISTQYRLASLLGWIRAFRRELSFLKINKKERLKSLKKAISFIESALADGPHIEKRRLEGLAELWGITLPRQSDIEVKISISLNNILQQKLHSAKVSVATELNQQDQYDICKKAAQVICRSLGIDWITEQIITETRARAIQMISIKESWLYRDWQAGIGDLMIKEVGHSSRAFDVIGFRDFEALKVSEDIENKRWLTRLNNIFDGIDVSIEDTFDARLQQLRNTMVATAKLVLALTDIQPHHHILLENTLNLAKEIISKEPGYVSTQ